MLSKLFAGAIALALSEPEEDCFCALRAVLAKFVVAVVGGVAEGFGAGSGELAVEPEGLEPAALMAVTISSLLQSLGR